MVENHYNNGKIEDADIAGYSALISPFHLKQQITLTEKAESTVKEGRRSIIDTLRGDGRKIIVVGPCSIHDVNAAQDYAERLRGLSERVKNIFTIVMRAYFKSPELLLVGKDSSMSLI